MKRRVKNERHEVILKFQRYTWKVLRLNPEFMSDSSRLSQEEVLKKWGVCPIQEKVLKELGLWDPQNESGGAMFQSLCGVRIVPSIISASRKLKISIDLEYPTWLIISHLESLIKDLKNTFKIPDKRLDWDYIGMSLQAYSLRQEGNKPAKIAQTLDVASFIQSRRIKKKTASKGRREDTRTPAQRAADFQMDREETDVAQVNRLIKHAEKMIRAGRVILP